MTDSTTPQDAAAMSPASAGSVAGEPVAWSIQWRGENRPDGHWTYADKGTAEICLAGCRVKGVVVPLYRSPTLTDEEREAIHFMFRHAAQAADHDPFPDSADYIPHHKVISAMMERLA